MRTPLTPVEAAPGKGTPLSPQSFDLDTESAQRTYTLGADVEIFLAFDDVTQFDESLDNRDRDLTGQMVVTGPGIAHGLIAWPRGPMARRPGLGNHRKSFNGVGDLRTAEPVITMPPLPLDNNHIGGLELGKVPAGGLWRDARDMCQLGRRERPTVHQCGEYAGARRITDQGRSFGDIGTFNHTTTITEVLLIDKSPHRLQTPAPELTTGNFAMTLTEWFTFAVIWTLLSLPLGPNAVNCMTAAVSNGFRRALWTVAGIALAGLCHMTIATLGFGTLLLRYAELYLTLKWLGIAYLVWIGLSLWRAPATFVEAGKNPGQTAGTLLRRGFSVSMSNPKAILSYMAAFPQFIAMELPLTPQLSIIVPTALIILILVYSGYTAVGGGLSGFLQTAARRRIFNRVAGSFYIFTAGLLALSDSRRS